MKNLKIVIFAACLLTVQNLFAASQPWVNSTHIKNLEETLTKAKQALQFKDLLGQDVPTLSFVTFPKKVPAFDQPLFANLNILEKNSEAMIIIGTSPGCSGEKSCMIASLVLEANKNPEIIYDSEKKQVTIPVTLHHGIQGFYSREYALGSSFPPSIVWRDGAVRFSLNVSGWKLSQDEMRNLANEIIDNLHKK